MSTAPHAMCSAQRRRVSATGMMKYARNVFIVLGLLCLCGPLLRSQVPRWGGTSTQEGLERLEARFASQEQQIALLKKQVGNTNPDASNLAASVKFLQLGRLHDEWLQLEKERPQKKDAFVRAKTAYEHAKKSGGKANEQEILYRRAEGARFAHEVTTQRVLDEMRELSHPGYKPPRDDSETFVPANPLNVSDVKLRPNYHPVNTSDVSIQFFKESKVNFNYNEFGVWGWKPGARYRDQYLVVIGHSGVPKETMTLLLNEGFVVWKRLLYCPGWCREAVTYLSYLADDSHPSKPLPPQVLFLHGHNASWHQTANLIPSMMESLECSTKTKRYTPLGWLGQTTAHDVWGNINDRFMKQYREHFGMLGMPRGDHFLTWCCAQFVVTRDLINSNTVSFYKRFLEKKLETKLDAYRFEFYYGYMFGEDESPPEVAWGKPKECQTLLPVTTPFVASSRTGEWTVQNAAITIVLGERSADEAESLEVVNSIVRAHPEVNVWRRHVNYWCSKLQWKGDLCCSKHRGYLEFWHDADRPVSDLYVFVRGNKPFTTESLKNILDKAECAAKRGRYTPLDASTRHNKTNVDMSFRFLYNKDKDYIPKSPLRGYVGGEFIVPHNVFANARQKALLDGYETYCVGCQYWLLPEHNLGHYWHWFFGENDQMESCPANAPLCADCTQRHT
eukprot:TRINITY_DN9151_c0_g1_i2.p1 TRINITY_DN9151_c0_g1~~TRINITY_DN9151_c0_g1_i2.p1  ORF type:complete len:675 (+),score=139.86 TRINITY_DN9151_c0_g1_i2:1671-3695(+)